MAIDYSSLVFEGFFTQTREITTELVDVLDGLAAPRVWHLELIDYINTNLFWIYNSEAETFETPDDYEMPVSWFDALKEDLEKPFLPQRMCDAALAMARPLNR